MILENKLAITDAVELAHAEEKISKAKAVELFKSGRLDQLQPGSWDSLVEIHKALFGDIYAFAGKLRTVDMAKGNFRFASLMYLEEAIKKIESMSQSNYNQIIEKYVEMNIAHPFREGNGRSMRIWLDLILKKELQEVVDWGQVDKEDYLLAMERSPVRDTEIKSLLHRALTHKIDDRHIFMTGIDASYAYEGFATYKTEDLGEE